MILIYGKSDCIWCDRAKDLCTEYNLEYEYKSIQVEEYLTELRDLVPTVKTVPQIFWYGRHIGGYNDLVTEIENTRNYGDGKI